MEIEYGYFELYTRIVINKKYVREIVRTQTPSQENTSVVSVWVGQNNIHKNSPQSQIIPR